MPRSFAVLLGLLIVTLPTTYTTTGFDASGSGGVQLVLLAISLVALIVLVATVRPVGPIRRR